MRIAAGALPLVLVALVAGAVDGAGPDGSAEAPASLADPVAALAAPPEVAERLGVVEVLPGGDPEAAAAALAAPGTPELTRLERAWGDPAPDFETRVERTRRAAFELGAWSLDAAARVLATGRTRQGDLDRATAAVTLAPDLPAAHMRLARARWLQDGDPMAALRAVVAAVRAIGRHLESTLWFGGTGLYVLAAALLGGGLLCIALAGVPALPHAAHDLGHRLPGGAPDYACAAALGALLLVPVALGEGWLGLFLALLGVGVVYGGGATRVALWLACIGIALGLHPAARYAGAALAALPEDPVARAAYSVSQGIATPVERSRLEVAAESDPLAARALAMHARRLGNLGEADAIYQRLLAGGADDIAVLNNAANVRLELGHMERAIELYRAAVAQRESPVLLFNLAQAYGRAFQVEDLNRTIARAQQVGGERVAQLTALQGTDTEGFVVDFPIPHALFWSRAREALPGAGVAAEFRRPLAPGHLGRDPWLLSGAMAAVLLVGGMLGGRTSPSRSCARCGGRMCSRCDARTRTGELCDACNKLYYQPESTDRVLRIQRVNELRLREERMDRVHSILSLFLPGAAGMLSKRPLSGWLGATCFALAVAALAWRQGVVPDPLVAGMAAPAVFVGVAVLAGLVYALAVATSLAARRNA